MKVDDICRPLNSAIGTCVTEATLAAQKAGAGGDHADQTAANLVVIAGVFGINWTSSDVAAWLVLLVPLFLEIGSSLGLVVAASFGGVQSVQRTPVEGVQSVETGRAETPAPSPSTGPEHLDDEPGGGAKAGVIKLLQDRGGSVQAGQRGLAKLIGTSTTRLNQVLQELAASGVVTLSTDKARGTQIELA